MIILRASQGVLFCTEPGTTTVAVCIQWVVEWDLNLMFPTNVINQQMQSLAIDKVHGI